MKNTIRKYLPLRIVLAVLFTVLYVVSVYVTCYRMDRITEYEGIAKEESGYQNHATGEVYDWCIYDQTFETDKDFYGVYLKAQGLYPIVTGNVTLKIYNQDTNQEVFEKTISAANIYNDKALQIVGDEPIVVDGLTRFRMEFSVEGSHSISAITLFTADNNSYENGEAFFNGESMDEDLIFDLALSPPVTDIGLFVARIVISTFIYAFLLLHLIFDIKKMYGFIYKYRAVIAILVFALCVIFKINFSSMDLYDDIVQQGEGEEYIQSVFGQGRVIRGDEWSVTTPRQISGSYNDYDKTNDIVMATTASNLSASGIQKGISAIVEPAKWGYILFGAEYGVSWFWCFRLIFGLLFCFELFNVLLNKENKLLALMGGVLMWFSPFNMWWSLNNMFLAASAALIGFNYYLEEKNKLKRSFWGIIVVVFAGNFVIDLYPAWLVPLGYVALMILIWIFVRNKESWKHYKVFDWLMIVGFVILLVALVGCYFIEYMDYINAVSATVYPGARVSNGDFALNKMGTYIPQWYMSWYQWNNCSEIGTIYSFFPLSLIVYVIAMYKTKCRNLLLDLLAIPTILLTLYCTVGIPMFLAKILLLSMSFGGRAVDILAILNLILFVVSIHIITKGKPLHKGVGLALSGVSIGVCLFFVGGLFEDSDLIIPIIVISLIVFLAQFVLLSVSKQQVRSIAMSVIIICSVISAFAVNPVNIGIDVFVKKPVSEEIQRIVEEDADAKWICIGNEKHSGFLIANGAPTLNSVNYVPNFELWNKLDPNGTYDKVYNRYAHISVVLEDGPTYVKLNDSDVITLHLNEADLQKTGVGYIYSTLELTSNDYEEFQEIYNHNGAIIYKVNYK